MAKSRTHFVCQSCGVQSAKWLGKCPDCGAWNSLVEEVQAREDSQRLWGPSSPAGRPVRLQDVVTAAEARRRTDIKELDRVLGGGVVPGSLVLLGGDPGIGKSTLLLAALDRLAREVPALYVSGEESLSQTKMRADRLRIGSPHLHLLAETDAEKVLAAVEVLKPSVVAIDSIQTMYLPDLGSAPGSIAQVREVAGRLMAFAKRSGVPTFLVGHVTKDGSIAGPRVLEHMVDTVLYFEGERGHPFRILRAHKNRSGRGSGSVGAVFVRASPGEAGLGGDVDHEWNPPFVGRSPGTGCTDRIRDGAPHRHRRRYQPGGSARRGARAKARRPADWVRHFRQCGGRHAVDRARLGSCSLCGVGFLAQKPPARAAHARP